MSLSTKLSADSLRDLAIEHGVCVRPVVHEVHDTVTGQVRLVPTPCGATRESKCGPCATKNRRLRMQPCREGWHLDEEPAADEPDGGPADDEPEVPDDNDDDPDAPRRNRSTKRRQDAPDLPRLPVEARTVGKAFTTPSGRTYRPSMFATFTLPSYGRVRGDGTPVDPDDYDYRRAALDALHFPKLVDRFWQNLRRAVGYQVQYFASVEPQHRLAPHLHAAIRGAVPRELLRQVVRGTYHQVWWPPHREPRYMGDRLPVWDEAIRRYVDPDDGVCLPTWEEALDALDDDPEARPAHVVRCGRQMDVQGIIATEGEADRRVAYLTKYLTKSIADAYGPGEQLTLAQRGHMNQLHEHARWLPCSPRCWNWLRYGVQPQGADDGMVPGQCPAKAHDRENLGCGGRRVLVSRKWTGKTLKGHKADRAAVVRQVLEAAGVEMHDADRLAADVRRDDGAPRFSWSIWNPLDATVPVYRQMMAHALAEKIHWRTQYDQAKQRDGPASVTTPLRPPDNQPAQVAGVAVQGERSESRSDTQCP